MIFSVVRALKGHTQQRRVKPSVPRVLALLGRILKELLCWVTVTCVDQDFASMARALFPNSDFQPTALAPTGFKLSVFLI